MASNCFLESIQRRRHTVINGTGISNNAKGDNNGTPVLTQSDVPINPLTGASFSSGYWELLEERKQLTIWEHKEQFMQLLDRPGIQFILLEAETGSGKTTQIPQWCVEWLQRTQPHRRPMVCCTQPRRLATLFVAQRVAQEMDVQLGQEVGYSMRFEEAISFNTVLKYCTDGVLLSEATRNNKLDQYDIIVLDEVHERTLYTDVVMGLVKEIAAARKELRVVVMSATLTTGNFSAYFDKRGAQLKIPGRTHPVEIVHAHWLKSTMCGGIKVDARLAINEYCVKAIEKVKEVHIQEQHTPGDILLFLTGEEEIETVCEELNSWVFDTGIGELHCLPLYSALPYEQQKLVFDWQPPPPGPQLPPGHPINRRCIVASNIAETSMTIEGVVFVIDPGFCKRNLFDPKTRIESLLVQPITQASAVQRAGRAGRTRPGKCYRLYSKDDLKRMKLVEPEIRHSNLANVVLRMKKFGVRNMETFDFMDAPPPELLGQAFTLLTNLKAFDANGRLTWLGTTMANLPVDPPLARMLVESINLGCSQEVITIVAMLSSQNCFYRPKKKRALADRSKVQFTNDRSDHLTLLRVFNAFDKTPAHVGARHDWCHANFLNYRALQNAADIREQLEDVMRKRLGVEVLSADPNLPLSMFKIIKALVAGSFTKVAIFKATSHGTHRPITKGHYVLMENVIGVKMGTSSAAMATRKMPAYQLHPGSVLSARRAYAFMPEWVLYEQATLLDDRKHYLRYVTVIRPEWLMELAADYYGRLLAINAQLHQRRLLSADEGEKEEEEEAETQSSVRELVASIIGALKLW